MTFRVIEGGRKGPARPELPPLGVNNVEVVRNWGIYERITAAHQQGTVVIVSLYDTDRHTTRHERVPVPSGTTYSHWDYCHEKDKQMTHYRLIFRKNRILAGNEPLG